MKNYKKTDHFEPIAMKCTQEQFKEIKPILEKYFTKNRFGVIGIFDSWRYLFNNFTSIRSDERLLTNRNLSDVENEIVYNEWNTEIFLKACGIVETEPTTKVRNSVLLKLADNNSYSEEILKKEFPQLFESLKLQIGKWYVVKNIQIGSLGFDGVGQYTEELSNGGLTKSEKGYNFKAPNGYIWRTNGDISQATPQEVEIALINEAKNRGFVKGSVISRCGINKDFHKNIFKPISGDYNFIFKDNLLESEDGFGYIFKNGIWATIIETPTDITAIVEKYGKDELQKYLNKL